MSDQASARACGKHLTHYPALGNVGSIVATGDFNGDGIPDLVVSGQTSVAVTVLLGNGDGTFSQAPDSPFSLGSGTFFVAVGDFNGDGKADLAVLSGGFPNNIVTIFLGNGDGTFKQAPGNPTSVSGITTQAEAVGDFNGDGILDLAVASGNDPGGSITILLGNGDGTFTPANGGPVTVGSSPNSVTVGDFNGDGIPDFASANFDDGTVSVFLGKGDGTFTQAANSPIKVGSFPYAISAADFNSDGKIDLAVANSAYTSNPPGTVTILLGNGDGTFTQATGSPVTVGSTPQSVSVGDFNGDGIPDLAVANNGNDTVTILLGSGSGAFTQAVNSPVSTGDFPQSVAVADFTGGGISDLAVGNENESLTVLLSEFETATATVNGVAPVGAATHNVDATYAGDSNYSASVSTTALLTAGAAMPVISPASGTFTSAQPITITDSTPGATIYYQALYNQPPGLIFGNGYVPYTGPIPMEGSGTLTINAYATASGYQQSVNASVTYVVNFPPAPTPVLSLASGEYPSTQTLTITDSAPGAQFYYTTNGTYPSTFSNLYSGPISVSNSEVVTAIALAPGYSDSGYATRQYYIGSSTSRFIYTIAGSFTFGYAGDGGLATLAELDGSGLRGVAVDGTGNVYMTDYNNNVVRKIAGGTGIITTIAGTGVAGHTGDNGPASSAELWGPTALAVDATGDLFIGETGDNVVRRIDAVTGNITTFGGNPTGTGSIGGPATSFPLYGIVGIACDHLGNLYVAESGDVVEVNAGTGNITEIAGYGNGVDVGILNGIAVDSSQNIYVSDSAYNVVRKINPQGVISVFAGTLTYAFGGDGGPATSAELYFPAGLAADGAGNIYIADDFDQAIREVNTSGIINTIGGILNDPYSSGGDGDPAADVGIYYPQVIAADNAGDVFFGDQESYRIRKITVPLAPPSSAAAAPVFSLTAGSYPSPQTLTITDATPGAEIYMSLNGTAPTTSNQGYHGPIQITGSVTVQAIAVAPGYLPSTPVSATYTISTPPTAVISTVAGNDKSGFVASGGPVISTSIGQPQAVAFDGSGNLYIADTANSVVWMVSASTGNISVVAGTGTSGNGAAGGQATETALSRPSGVAIDKSGDIFIADTDNGIIREVAAQTGVITTVAGPGIPSTLGDGGPATSAYLGYADGIVFDKTGNLYVADPSTSRVRMIAANTGIISTVAGGGTQGQLGDGGLATAAYVGAPEDVALDALGNIYIADADSQRIRMVDASTGIITTIAGNGAIGDSGDGGDGGLATAAQINVGQGIAVDGNGNVYFSNFQDTIRRVDAVTQIITTIAGDGYFGYGGDGGAASMAELFDPQGLAFDAAGNLYIADNGNYAVREVTFPGPAPAPVFSPAPGTYHTTQTVTISDTTKGAIIYYTTDGSTPTTTSDLYNGSITVSLTETLQAIAVATGYTESAVTTAQYTITPPAAPVITWSPPAAINYGTALSSTQLDATTTVAGTFAYNPAAGTVPGAGTEILSVTFTPTDTTDYTTATASVSLTVNKAAPPITWVAPAAITYGTALTATQLDASSTVAGSFTYSPLAGAVPAAGTQTLSVTLTPSDATDYTNATASVSLTVTKGTPNVAVTPAASSISTTQSLNVTVAVSASGSGITPSGTVVLSGGGYTSSAAILSGGSATLTISAGLLVTGTDTLVATYTPDAGSSPDYNGSGGSATVAVTTPSKMTPTVAVTPSAASITTSQSLTLTIVVSGGTGNPTPTGSVVVSGGGYASSAMALSSGSASINVPAGSLNTGTDALSVVYTPDTSSSTTYNSATGATTVTVSAPVKLSPSVSVTAVTTPITNEETDTVSVTVTGASGQPAPTGTVTLASGTYSAQQTLSSGAVSFTIAVGALASGADTLTATYSGDAIYAGSSGTATVTVSAVLVAAPAPAEVLAGASGNSTVTFTAGSNYSGTMKVACSLTSSPTGAVSLPTCGLSPASVTIASGGTGTTTFTANTTAASSAMLKPANENLWRLGGGTVLEPVINFIPLFALL